jgi:hypothetical protein
MVVRLWSCTTTRKWCPSQAYAPEDGSWESRSSSCEALISEQTVRSVVHLAEEISLVSLLELMIIPGGLFLGWLFRMIEDGEAQARGK